MINRRTFNKIKPVNPVVTTWRDFSKGLNTNFDATKIRDDELSRADNILLYDQGSPGRRWGTVNHDSETGGTTSTLLAAYYKSTGTRQKTRIKDGIFKIYSSGTWSTVTGASFPSGGNATQAMTNDTLYISNGVDPLTKYDGSSLTRFTTLSTPTGLGVSRGASLASGIYQYSYRVSAVNEVGETLASSGVQIQVNKKRDEWNLNPEALDANYSNVLTWTAVSNATGYNIYGVINGSETYLDHVDGNGVVTYRDYGQKIPSSVFSPPSGNNTDAPKGKYIREFKSALLIAGDPNVPSRLYFSAGVDKPDSFVIADGGGFVDISKNSDDGNITGISPVYQNKVFIFKDRSTWQLDFTDSIVPQLTNISRSIGCVSHRTITIMENDLIFLGRKPGGGAAIYVLGNEPNFLNVLRTNELSTRVRPELLALNESNFEEATALYIDGKYILWYAEGSSTYNNKALIYDRERLGFTKWDGVNANHAITFYDTDGNEEIVYIDGSDNRVCLLGSTYTDDRGQPIEWAYRTKENDLKSPYNQKRYREIRIRFRDVGGTITLNVYRDSTNRIVSKQIGVGASNIETAFRSWGFRVGRFRKTVAGNTAMPETVEVLRIPLAQIGREAIGKTTSLEVTGTQSASRATLLDYEVKAEPMNENYYDRTERVNI